MKNAISILALLALPALAADPGVELARRGTLSSQSNVVVDVHAARLIGPYVDGALVDGPTTNRLLTTASAGVRNPFGLRYGLPGSFLSYTGAAVGGLYFGNGLSWTSDGTNGTVSVDGTYLAGLGYALASDVSTALSGKQANLSDSQLAAAGSGITQAKREGYDAHVASNDLHVTVAQKAEWSGKQDALTPAQTNAVNSGITAYELELLETHRSDRTIHINEEFLAANADKAFVTGQVASVRSDFADATNAARRAMARLPGIASHAVAGDFLCELRAEPPGLAYARAWAASHPNFSRGTAFSKGGLLAADHVLGYSSNAVFVVTTPAGEGRRAVLGVAVPGMDWADASAPKWREDWAAVPCMLVSGVNDSGLAAAATAVPSARAAAANAFPSAASSVPAAAVVDWALAGFSSARDAALALTNGTVGVSLPAPSLSPYGIHLMLADSSGAAVVVELPGTSQTARDSAAMSDFSLAGVSFQPVSGRAVASTVEAYGIGLERFNAVVDGVSSVTNAADAMALLSGLRYTRLYTDAEHPRYTELCGADAALTVTADASLFSSYLEAERTAYLFRSRDGRTLHSAVQAVYDAASAKLVLRVQEGDAQYAFSFPGGSGVSEEWLVEQGFVRDSDVEARVGPIDGDVTQLKAWRSSKEAVYDAKQDALTEAQTNAVNSGITSSKRSGYDTHVANGDIHVTASQKTAWSAKQDALTTAQTNAVNSGVTSSKVSGYDSHVANSGIHVTAAQKTAWSAKQDALNAAQTNAVNSGATSAKVSTWDGYGPLIAALQSTKVDADDVYTKGEIELVVLRNLVDMTITNHLSNLTWDDSYHVMWKKRADAGCFFETAYTNVNVLVEGTP